MKKIIALFICLVMIVPTVSLPVTATTADKTSVTDERDKNKDGYDDSNVYLAEIMLAISHGGGDEAKDAIASRGFNLYDVDIYHNVSNNHYMYLGYKTTTDPKKALTDIKWEVYTDSQFEDGYVPLVVSCGNDGAYVATKVHYDEAEYLKYNGQFGFTSDDFAGYELLFWLEDYLGYTGAVILKTVMEFLIVGFIGEAIMEAALYADYYSCMYFAANPSFGDPILADSLLLSEEQNLEGYEVVTGFATSNPEDLRWARSQAGKDTDDYSSLNMYFKRAKKLGEQEEIQLDDVEYIKELSFCDSDQNLDSIRNQGWIIDEANEIGVKYVMTSFQPRSGYLKRYYLMYRTTRNPKEAVTDIRMFGSGPKICNIGGVSYFQALDAGSSETVYFSRASNMGVPIQASSLKVHLNSEPRMNKGEVYARNIFASQCGTLTSKEGNYGGTYRISYKGVHYKQAAGKYISDIYIVRSGSTTEKLNSLASQGAEAYIDRELNDGIMIGYATTDNEELAITDIILNRLPTEATDIVMEYPTSDYTYTSWETAYFAVEKPAARIVHNDSVYTLIGKGINISNPGREEDSDFKSHQGDSYNYFNETYLLSDWDRNFLYYTKDVMAGDPITRITFESDSIMNNGSKAVMCGDAPKRYSAGYITKNYESQDTNTYITGIYAASGDSREAAMNSLVNLDYNYFVDYDMNKGCDGDSVFIGYKKSSSKRRAIRDIKLLIAYSGDIYEVNGIKYYPVKGVNLNSGNEGSYAKLFYTTDPAAGEPLTGLQAHEFSIYMQLEYEVVLDQYNIPADANDNIGSTHIYLMCQRDSGEIKKYIEEIHIEASESRYDAIYNLSKLNGGVDTYIDYDLNTEAGGDWIYMGYNVTTEKENAITDIIMYHGSNPPWSLTYNGIYYYLAQAGTEVDLNKNSGGDYIYLYYTKDSAAGAPITKLEIHDWAIINNGSKVAMRYDRNYPSDLNTGAGGSDVYLHMTRDEDLYKKYICNVHVASSDSWRINLQKLAAQGCEYFLDYDLNHGTGGDWTYIGYSRTSNPDEALRGLAAWQDGGEPNSFEMDNALFRIVDYVDMSHGTGGAWMYLYQTYDKAYGDPIIDIDAYGYRYDTYETSLQKLFDEKFKQLAGTDNKAFNEDYQKVKDMYCSWDIVNNQYNDPCEFNKGTGGPDIFIYTSRMPQVYQDVKYITSIVGFDYRTDRADNAKAILRENNAPSLFYTLSADTGTEIQLAGTLEKNTENAIRDIIAIEIPIGEAVKPSVVINDITYYVVGGYVETQNNPPADSEESDETPEISDESDGADETSETNDKSEEMNETPETNDKSDGTNETPETDDKPDGQETAKDEYSYNEVAALAFNQYSDGIGVYLYYTTDKRAGDPISQIKFTDSSELENAEWNFSMAYEPKDVDSLQYSIIIFLGESYSNSTGNIRFTGEKANFGTEEAPLYLQFKRPSLYLASVFSVPSVYKLPILLFIILSGSAVVILVKKRRDKKLKSR